MIIESTCKAFLFEKYDKEILINFYNKRNGEYKIGDKLSESSVKKFQILLIEEDLGPRMNNGLPGAGNGLDAFVSSFLNMQSNIFLKGDDIEFIGRIKQNNDNKEAKVEDLDEFVYNVLVKFHDKKSKLIVIGGGHNNAYPTIKYFSVLNNSKLDIVNLDPHADLRSTEFRHSGNPFSFAVINNYIDTYAVIGLHQQYNNEFIIDFIKENKVYHSFFEEYILGQKSLEQDIQNITNLFTSKKIGIELDVDAIKNFPSSALTPSGISIEEARKYLMLTAKFKGVCYLHIPEAAPINDQEKRLVGKSLAYFVCDFIKNS